MKYLKRFGRNWQKSNSMAQYNIAPGSKTALITGSGRGLGKAYAKQLAGLGYNLVLVGKSENVQATASELSISHPEIKTFPIIQDLAQQDAAQKVYGQVRSSGINVDVLINNAGMFSFKDIASTPDERIERMLCLHNLTLTKLCKLFSTDMATRGGGHILNMSSYSIWMPLPGLSIYGASKAYTKAFSIAFAKEVRENNIYVTAICPAGIATDLYGLSKDMQALGVRLGVLLTPERCAKLALRKMWKKKKSAVPDWWNCAFIPILTHLPNWAENILRRKTMKFQK